MYAHYMKKPTQIQSIETAPSLTFKTKPIATESSRRTAPVSHRAIEKRAYYIYLNQGSKQGHHLDHWMEAEAFETNGK
jgi:hypothetical protein